MSAMLYYVLGALILTVLVFSIYLNVKLGLTILKVEDSIEECLDQIDERYNSISKILEIPIFFDSVEVRRVISDIEATRNALLIVANKLSNIEGEKE